MKSRMALAALGVFLALVGLRPVEAASHVPNPGSISRTFGSQRRNRAFRNAWYRLEERDPTPDNSMFVVVDVARQRLYLFKNGYRVNTWPVSTAIAGTGERDGSFRTPVGVFRIARKIGGGLPFNTVIHDQVPTNRTAHFAVAPTDITASQVIIARVLWLQGLQQGWNAGHGVNTYLRHIYIHGTPNLGMLGEPASRGCVQMSPWAVISLYRRVPVGTLVLITPGNGSLYRIPGPYFSDHGNMRVASRYK